MFALNFIIKNKTIVMVWWSIEGQDAGSGVSKNGDHSRHTQQTGFICSAADNFPAHPKSSLARTDKRTVRAARNTRHHYNKIGPLDHNMADNRASPARTNTASSTTTKPIKTWKTSNKNYSHNPVNCTNKMHTHDLLYLQQEWEAWHAPVHKQIHTTKPQPTQCTKHNCH